MAEGEGGVIKTTASEAAFTTTDMAVSSMTEAKTDRPAAPSAVEEEAVEVEGAVAVAVAGIEL